MAMLVCSASHGRGLYDDVINDPTSDEEVGDKDEEEGLVGGGHLEPSRTTDLDVRHRQNAENWLQQGLHPDSPDSPPNEPTPHSGNRLPPSEGS